MKKSTLSIAEVIAIALEKIKNHDYDRYYINHTIEAEVKVRCTDVSYFRSVNFYIGDMHYTVQFHRYRVHYPKSGYVFRSDDIPERKYAVTGYTDTFNKYETTRFITVMVEY